MIIKITNKNTNEELKNILQYLNNNNIEFERKNYQDYSVLFVETKHLNVSDLKTNHPNFLYFTKEKYVLVSRKFKNQDTIIKINEQLEIGKEFEIIAGPCSVEKEPIMDEIANKIANLGIKLIRGGTFKPRTSPYDFQGLKDEGLEIISEISKKYNIASVSEILDYNLIEKYDQFIDVYQVGARNMQNYELLNELGSRTKKPIILKRGPSATIDEWLMSAEYLMKAGNENIILCERGLKTISDKTRNTLDISSVIALNELTHLPVIVDPSHGSGRSDMVLKLSLASLVVGAKGIIIEVHPKPQESLSDPDQAIDLLELDELVRKVNKLKGVL